MATYFIDIDGCILRHHSYAPSKQWSDVSPSVLPDVRLKLDALERAGHRIILVTARPEHNRRYLQEILHSYGIVYHTLIMDVGHGTRILVNDIKANGDQSAIAVNLKRNAGLGDVPCL